MGVTAVLSGAQTSRPQATAALRQAGFTVDDSDSPHGFTPDSGEGFVTVHGNHVDPAVLAVEHLGWRLRSHWEQTGDWQKLGNGGSPTIRVGESAELARFKAELQAQLRAAGIKVDL